MNLKSSYLFLIIVGTWLLAPTIVSWMLPSWAERVQFGTPSLTAIAFGAINALFSGLAFASLFWTIGMQRE